MKILLICGRLSDRAALEGAAEALRREGLEAEVFSPIKTENLVCSGCGACKGAGMCVYDPRGQDFVRAAVGCDAFLFAAPAGLFGLDVDMKNFLERVAALTLRREVNPLAGKPAAAVILCRRGGRAADQMTALLRQLGLRLPAGEKPPVLRSEDPDLPQALCAVAAGLTDTLRREEQ